VPVCIQMREGVSLIEEKAGKEKSLWRWDKRKVLVGKENPAGEDRWKSGDQLL